MSTRMISNTLFGAAIGLAGSLKICEVPEPLVWLAVSSVVIAMILTNLVRIRSVGLVGVSGLSMAYMTLSGQYFPAAAITILVTIMLVLAVLLAIWANQSISSKG
jgi:hypothetical protein